MFVTFIFFLCRTRAAVRPNHSELRTRPPPTLRERNQTPLLRRPTMEDRSVVIQDLGLDGLAGTFLWPQTFAAVFDGHGGGQASEYLWGNLHMKVEAHLLGTSMFGHILLVSWEGFVL